MMKKKLVKKLQIYSRLMRFHQPVGIYLVLWPTLTALWIASEGIPSLKWLLVFGAGSLLMRSAGCVINDIVDRKIDSHVERTAKRPLATGEASVGEALMLAIVLLALSGSLLWYFDLTTRWLAVIAVFLTLLYPWMKRIMPAPQCILGLAFAWASPMAFSAIRGNFALETWLWMIAMMAWPIAYDTLYAQIDARDDASIGVLSTARWLGVWAPTAVLGAHGVALVSLVILGLWLSFNFLWWMGLIAAGAFAWVQYRSSASTSSDEWFRAFLSHQWLLFFIFMLAVMQYPRASLA